MKITKWNVIKLSCIILFILVAAPSLYAAVMNMIPVFEKVWQGGSSDVIKQELRSFGVQGISIMMLLQVLQILTVVIPAPVIWIIGGATYGIIPGMLMCLVGINIANSIAFTLAKKVGAPIISKILGKKKSVENFFSKSKHPLIILFILYIVPGIPNGVVPYLAGVTSMRLRSFLITTSIAIVPSILLCTLVGDQLASGRLITAGIMIGIIILLAGLLFVFRKKVFAFMTDIADKDIKINKK